MEIRFAKEKWSVCSREVCNAAELQGECAVLKKESASAMILHTTLPVAAGKSYRLRIPCEPDGCNYAQAPYAMLSWFDGDGSGMLRKYLDSGDGERLMAFSMPEGCAAVRLELGLKGTGTVRWGVPVLEEVPPAIHRKAKIAALMVSESREREEALGKIVQAVTAAGEAGADLTLLAEAIHDYGCGLSVQESAETMDGSYAVRMRELARKYGMYIVFNFHERDEANRCYNTSVLLDRHGETVGKYRKTHMSHREFENGITAGDSFAVFETDFAKVGMLICWDAYFPEPARVLSGMGAELLLISTVGDPAVRHIARAEENGIFVAVAGLQYNNAYGIYPSKIIDPCGNVLAMTKEDGKPAIWEIDFDEQKTIPWLSVGAPGIPGNIYRNERRADLYGNLTEGKRAEKF